MDGVIFSDCLVAGLPSPRPDVSSDSATAYQVPDSAVTAQALSHYRPIAAAHAVVSDLPGLPAIPGSEDREISLGTGGLVLWGGRISSLLIRGTQFKDDGKFCVRDAAGSGMDIVEQLEAASFEFTGCAIRHLTCSVPLNRDRSIGAIVIEAYDCSIVQAWLGQHLRGEFAVKNSLIVDIRSASSELKATASDGCRYADLVGVHVDNSCEPLPGDRGTREFTRDDAALFERLSGSLDYRRSMSDDPAVRRRLERIAEHGDK